MARMVVRTGDSVHTDFYCDVKCWKRGMVVDILPDGMSLGTSGDKSPKFVVVEVMATREELSSFLGTEPALVQGEEKTTQRRGFHFDLNAWIADGRRRLSLAQALTYKRVQPRRSDAL